VKRLLPFIPLAVCGLLVVLFAGYGLHHDPHVNPAALVGKPLPADSLPPLTGGQPMPIGSAASPPMVVNVFASWCAPCAEEAPQLMALKAAGVPMVGVAYKDLPGATQAFLDKYGDPFGQVLQDRSGDVGVDFGISGVPETFVVDTHGMIVAKHIGPMTDQDVQTLAGQIAALRAQAAR
jgi:cytochrome c biogenesis protein CcmG/thiol:disulfide interchange protein DsbE